MQVSRGAIDRAEDGGREEEVGGELVAMLKAAYFPEHYAPVRHGVSVPVRAGASWGFSINNQENSMKTLKSEINETAHCMAQVSQTRIRYALEAKCKALLLAGQSSEDVGRYLKQAALGGIGALDALLSSSGRGRGNKSDIRPREVDCP